MSTFRKKTEDAIKAKFLTLPVHTLISIVHFPVSVPLIKVLMVFYGLCDHLSDGFWKAFLDIEENRSSFYFPCSVTYGSPLETLLPHKT